MYHNTHCLNFVQYRGRCAELPLWACAGHESESIVPANAYRIPRIPLVGMIFQILVDYWDGLSVGLPHYHKPSHYHYISFDKLTKLNRLLMDKSTIKSINDHFQLFFVCLPEGVFFSTSAKAFGERYQHSDGAFHDSQLRLRRASQAPWRGLFWRCCLQ